jgi:hypothetical protein
MNLQLALNSQYFEEIQSGAKTEEYRLCTEYWKKRLVGREYDQLIFTKGYPKKNDESRKMHFQYSGYTIKTITHPHFGVCPVEVFAIRIKEIISDLDLALYRAGMLE